jgi:hypothetical protein
MRRRMPPTLSVSTFTMLLAGCETPRGSLPWLAALGGVTLIALVVIARRAYAHARAPSFDEAEATIVAPPSHLEQLYPSQPHQSTQALLRARELELAHQMQRRMYPHGVVRVPGFAVTGHAQMADACGGDWWSCHALPDGRLMIAVGDVTGHGLASALVAVLARGIVEGAARSLGADASPTRLIATLAASIAELDDDRHGMTCCVVVLDPATGGVQLASAGHPFPYVRRACGSLEVIMARGAPLGGPAPSIGTAKAVLSPGDMLVLCSDGLADRVGDDGRRFGERRLRQLLAGHAPEQDTGVRRLRSDIVTAMKSFATAVEPDDDLTLVVCEYRERVALDEDVPDLSGGEAPVVRTRSPRAPSHLS